MKLDTKAFEDKMKKTIAVLEEEFACIRIGRASARVLDKITVPYYGTPTAVDEMCIRDRSTTMYHTISSRTCRVM